MDKFYDLYDNNNNNNNNTYNYHHHANSNRKQMNAFKSSLLLLCAAFICGSAWTKVSVDTPSPPVPRLILWSWEHDDDLSYVQPRDAAVAYYAGTILLGRDIATFHKRKNPLHVNKGVYCFPVFRIENAHPAESLSNSACASALQLIKDYADKRRPPKIQIDFDATAGERQAYSVFLHNLKKQLPPNTLISITALASWCLADKWLQAAAVDETVAMMFSLGRGKKDALQTLSSTKLDSGANCSQSVGLAVYELNTNRQLRLNHCLDNPKHIYAFSALGWNASQYKQLLHEVDK